jgi:uncharacterized membrane protein YhaH (DUF805 family)
MRLRNPSFHECASVFDFINGCACLLSKLKEFNMTELDGKDVAYPNGFSDTEGRIGRLRYAGLFLLQILIAVPSSIYITVNGDSIFAQLVFGCILFFIFAPTVIKRLHDIDKTGVWMWGLFVPFLNILIQLRLLFQSGMPGSNRFGPPVNALPSLKSRVSAVVTSRKESTFASSELTSAEKEDIYEFAANEIERNELKKGLWAKSFADADGNESVAKARYIRARTEQLFLEKKLNQKSIDTVNSDTIDEKCDHNFEKRENEDLHQRAVRTAEQIKTPLDHQKDMDELIRIMRK